MDASIDAIHDAACAAGELSYRDPATGYRVFTRLGLERRGRCCGCGCRHCPFGHERVEDKAARIQQPAWVHRRAARVAAPTWRDLLFWSGGKDSLLALRAWLRRADTGVERLVLVTTFDAKSRVVAHQDVPFSDIERQARWLDIDLIGVPLHPGSDYLERVGAGLERLAGDGDTPRTLVFGDLHLAHVRQWRDESLARFGIDLAYPLWQASYDALLADLRLSGVPCTVSAVAGVPDMVIPAALEGLAPGRPFDEALSRAMAAAGWDGFGENGEIHTLARVWEVDPEQALGTGRAS